MLITMDTLTQRDLSTWDDMARFDEKIWTRTQQKIKAAGHAVTEFTTRHPDAVCATSWGKDSVIVCWIVRTFSPSTPIVWVPTIREDGASYEAEATYEVADIFLSLFPGPYEERPAVARNPKRGDPRYNPRQYEQAGYRSQDVLKENIPEPSINGVRTEESSMRQKSARWHGINSKYSSRPVLNWRATDIFAALHGLDLPVHPAYAATYGGRLDRRWLRVHPLRSKPPAQSTVYGWDMTGWEDDYFPTLTRHRQTGTKRRKGANPINQT